MSELAQENIFRRAKWLRGVWSRPWLVLTITYSFVLLVLGAVVYILEPWQAKALVPLFFLYAALPFPLIFVRLIKGKNLAEHASGNISLSNSFRVGAWAAGALTFLGEASKGFLAPHCREGYADVLGALAHLENVGPLLQEALKIADLTRLEIHGPEAELAKLRKPMADLKPQYFTLEYSFRP